MPQTQFIFIILSIGAVILWITASLLKEKLAARKKTAERTDPAPPPVVSVPAPVPIKNTIQESEDSKYAIHQNMWVCAYCETLNPCPSRMKRIADKKSLCEASPVTGNGLRGDLFKKANEANAGIVTMELQCTACGKTQRVTS